MYLSPQNYGMLVSMFCDQSHKFGRYRDNNYYVSTLVCIPMFRNSDHGYSNVLSACERTLKNLQLDYLNLYLVHWPLVPKKTENKERLVYDADVEAKCWEVE